MPAEVEEPVVSSDALDVEELLPELGEPGLDRPGGGDELRRGELGVGQARSVDLARGGERQGVEVDGGGGDHVRGQLPGDGVAQRRPLDLLSRPVGDEALPLDPHDGLPDAGLRLVNLQGDEPLLSPGLLDELARALAAHRRAGVATMATPLRHVDELFEESVVKCVLDAEGYALTFSRAPIPWVRGGFDPRPAQLPEGVPFLRHLGLYGYRVRTLRAVQRAEPAAIERAESLEQLRALSLGIPIHVTVTLDAPPPGVDTPEDLARVRRAFGDG